MRHRHPLLHRIARALFVLFLGVVAVLLVRYARGVEWPAVAGAVAGYDATTLLLAALLTGLSYLTYCGYDLAARAYSGHHLSARRVMAIGFTCYAFGLNLGALIGSAGFRYRMYSHSGLHLGTISRIVAYSVSANWLGYILLGGVLFAWPMVTPPPGWEIGVPGLRLLGWAMLAATMAYLGACSVLHGRVYHARGHHFRLPSLPLAAMQLLLAGMNWSIMAAIVFVLLRQQVAYPQVLGVLLLAAVASAVAHIPAGIGVLEAVFVALLGQAVPQPQLLAALLTYRAIYYLGPLLLAIVAYAAFEARGSRPREAGTSPPA
jgi:uncharacterized membrane protein YbhN (UPF0104 family)